MPPQGTEIANVLMGFCAFSGLEVEESILSPRMLDTKQVLRNVWVGPGQQNGGHGLGKGHIWDYLCHIMACGILMQ
jgi:hypothetical protein